MSFTLYISNTKDLPDKIYQGSPRYIEKIILNSGNYDHGIQYFQIESDLKEEVLIDKGIEYLEKMSYMSQYELSFMVNIDTARFLGTLKLHDTFYYEDYRGDIIYPDEWDVEIDEPSNDVDTHFRKVIIKIKFNFFTKLANNVNYIEETGVVTKPYATNVEITGDNSEGSTLTGNYTYNDDEGSAEGATNFKWYRSNDQFGTNKQLIGGATSQTYVIQNSDLNKWLTFQVQPIATEVPTDGDWVESPYFVIENNTAPIASNVELDTLTPEVGIEITASYDYSDSDNDLQDVPATIQRWYFADDKYGANKFIVFGENGNTYTPTEFWVGKFLAYSVIPHALTGIEVGDESFTDEFYLIIPLA